MARWFRSRLRVAGVGAVALVGGSLLAVPMVSNAAEQPVAAHRPAVVPASDRVAVVPGRKGRSAFSFQAASGDSRAPYGFASAGGTVRARQFKAGHDEVQAATGTPVKPAAKVAAAATSYTTTLTIDSANWAAQSKLMVLWNRASWTYVQVTNPQYSLSATASLPPGDYYAAAIYGNYGYDSYLLTKAFTVTTKAQTVHLAESSAKAVGFTVDDSTARMDMSAVWLSIPGGDVVGFAGGVPGTKTHVTTASVAGPTLRAHETMIKSGSSALKPSPYRYDLTKSWSHPLPASPMTAVKTSTLAKGTTTIRAQGVSTDASYMTVPMVGDVTGAYLPTTMRAPGSFTEYVTPGVNMSRAAAYGNSRHFLTLPDRTLAAGPVPAETVGDAPLMPRRQAGNESRRSGTYMQISEYSPLGDADGHTGNDSASASTTTLSSGGEVLKSASGLGLGVNAPQIQQTYQLKQTVTRKVGWSQLTTKVDSAWTFASEAGQGPLPLMDVAVSATGLDTRNRAGAATPVTLTVRPSTRNGTATSRVDKVEWSTDDGATWTTADPTSISVPATAAFVSLRLTVANDEGGSLVRTVLRAFAGPATGDDAVGSTTISNVKVNGGGGFIIGTEAGTLTMPATFTASDPAGISAAGLVLWHGSDFNAPDGVLIADTTCTADTATSSSCVASVPIWDVRYALNSNALAGAWHAQVWATSKDGTSLVDKHSGGSVALKRNTTLTADATPEPVKKGKTITVTGAQTRADWESWTYKAFASQKVSLQWAKIGTSAWTTVKSVTGDSAGKLKTTTTAGSDGSYRFSFPGDPANGAVTSAADYVDVQ